MEPAPKGAGSKEVSGEADGVTLAECFADGRVPVPDRMSFPKWQQWRKAEGRRPTKRKDGVGLSTAEEVALWRTTMEALYGEKEADEADESEDDDPGSPGRLAQEQESFQTATLADWL